jgi:type II secretory pathway pseudopilin PulG
LNTPSIIDLIHGTHKHSFPARRDTQGSVLVYLIVVILIFGVLGVTMVSLFTTATTSSATSNDARRALSMAESGTRYAMSELRRNKFADDTFKTLNETKYKIDQENNFEFNIYSISLRSPSTPSSQNNPTILLRKRFTDIGDIPDNFSLPYNSIYAINMDPLPNSSGVVYYPSDSDSSTAKIQNFAKNGASSYSMSVADTFTVENGVIVSLAVKPLPNQSPSAGGSLDVEPDAQFFFPKRNGAVVLRNKALFYERAIYHNSGPERVELTKLSDAVTIPTNIDNYYTILAPENYVILPTGTSGNASYGNDIEYTVNLYDQRIRDPADGTYVPQGKRNPDIEPEELTDNISEVKTGPDVVTPIPDDDSLEIGGSPPPGPDADFGAAWYSGNQSIGGDTDVCNTGACLFGRGIRVFFTLTYTGEGDGFTFTIMNADPTDGNDITSVGGDPEGSELLAYAGDSRVDLAGTAFLDGNRGRGIVPPKLAVEFDAKTNFDQDFEDEAIKNYCTGPNLRQNTRNDPLPGGAEKDTIQFVYWADRNPIDIPCRPNGDPVYSTASYDDNRHASSTDPENERSLFLTDTKLDVTPSNNWLNDGPWAVRLEVERSIVQNAGGNFDYKLRLWMRQCDQADCNDILGTFFQDARIKYDYAAMADLPLTQEIELSQTDHIKFNRFLFGFTTATAPGDSQSALIEHFNLSFIRPNDPVITNDPNWPPP